MTFWLYRLLFSDRDVKIREWNAVDLLQDALQLHGTVKLHDLKRFQRAELMQTVRIGEEGYLIK